ELWAKEDYTGDGGLEMEAFTTLFLSLQESGLIHVDRSRFMNSARTSMSGFASVASERTVSLAGEARVLAGTAAERAAHAAALAELRRQSDTMRIRLLTADSASHAAELSAAAIDPDAAAAEAAAAAASAAQQRVDTATAGQFAVGGFVPGGALGGARRPRAERSISGTFGR
ncbi:MAG: hypothetical protein VX385_05800, partial [Acidobacteriota bacterium]|nr:hypothetical protein [Acidobacteriota bacterium]